MVKHIILWQLNESLETEKKEQIKKEMKENLEGLVGKVPGLVSMTIRIAPLASSNAEVMLESVHESEEALKAYSVHPAHVEVANTFVRPYTKVRMCMDFEMEK